MYLKKKSIDWHYATYSGTTSSWKYSTRTSSVDLACLGLVTVVTWPNHARSGQCHNTWCDELWVLQIFWSLSSQEVEVFQMKVNGGRATAQPQHQCHCKRAFQETLHSLAKAQGPYQNTTSENLCSKLKISKSGRRESAKWAYFPSEVYSVGQQVLQLFSSMDQVVCAQQPVPSMTTVAMPYINNQSHYTSKQEAIPNKKSGIVLNVSI